VAGFAKALLTTVFEAAIMRRVLESDGAFNAKHGITTGFSIS
jgi:hypothetical protein